MLYIQRVLFFSALYTKSPYYSVLYMQRGTYHSPAPGHSRLAAPPPRPRRRPLAARAARRSRIVKGESLDSCHPRPRLPTGYERSRRGESRDIPLGVATSTRALRFLSR